MTSLRTEAHAEKFRALSDFISTHGRLPQRRETSAPESLFLWMSRMRSKYEQGVLDPVFVEQFESLEVNPLTSNMRSARLFQIEEFRTFFQTYDRWPGHSSDADELRLYETLKSWRARIRFGDNLLLVSDLEKHFPQLLHVLTSGTVLRSARDTAFDEQIQRYESFCRSAGRLPKIVVSDSDEFALARWFSRTKKKHDSGQLGPFMSESFEALVKRTKTAGLVR